MKREIENEELKLILDVLLRLEVQASAMAEHLGQQINTVTAKVDKDNIPSDVSRAIVGARSILDKYGAITYLGLGSEQPNRKPRADSTYSKL